MRSLIVAALAAVTMGLSAAAEAATPVGIYTSKSAWQAAIASQYPNSPITHDPFDNSIGSGTTITFDSGVTSTKFGGGIGNGVSSSGFYFGTLGGLTGSDKVVWTFPTSVAPFGIVGYGLQIREARNTTYIQGVYDGSNQLSITFTDVLPTNCVGIGRFCTNVAAGFLGVVGTAPFNTVTFDTNNLFVDDFKVDDLHFASAVPEPAVWMMMISGFALVAMQLRRRRRQSGVAASA